MNVTQALNALFKEVYGDKLEHLVPEGTKFLKSLPFREAERLGKEFVQPVMLSHEQGFTYNADGSAFALNNTVPAQFLDARVEGAELLLKTAISYRQAAQAAEKGKKSFVSWSSLLIKNMMDSMSKRLEIGYLYGRRGLGIVASVTNNTTAGTSAVVITDVSFASGIWSGAEGTRVDVRTAAVGGVSRGVGSISNINLIAKSFTITFDTASNAAVVAADVIVYAGSNASATATPSFTEFLGLDAIINESGTLFNISTSAFGLWKSTVITPSTLVAPSFALILQGISAAAGKGLDQDVDVYLAPEQYEVLNSADPAALRSYDWSYNENMAKNGAKEITYYGQSGMVRIVPNIHVKLGDCFIVPAKGDYLKRIGATDMTFRLPGKEAEEIFRELDGAAGYELRLYTDQALFCDHPGYLVKIDLAAP